MVPETTRLQALYVGELRALEDDGALTGLYKSPADGAQALHRDGLVNDRQADMKHHGGPERALSHYPAEHYAHWVQTFPNHAGAFVPSVLGENLSTHGLTEHEVCIGDTYRLGSALVQVSQPRTPCWKISRRLGIIDLAKAVAETGRSGWLYRVLEPGHIAAGDGFILHDRPHGDITLAQLWALKNHRDPDLGRLQEVAALTALAPSWRGGFASRLDYLRKKK